MNEQVIGHRDSIEENLMDLRSNVLLLRLVFDSICHSGLATTIDGDRISAFNTTIFAVEQYSRDVSDNWQFFYDDIKGIIT